MALSVLITGASSGIGAALAREYDKRGARVALLARRKDRLETLAKELRDAQAVACDVTDDTSVQGASREVLGAFGEIDVVIANAAIVPAGTGGAVTVLASNPTDLIIDIVGYFAP